MTETKQGQPIGVRKLRAMIRAAFGEYVRTEGCSCCRDNDGHEAAAARLGALLKVKKYDDGSGYDFYRYATPEPPDAD